MKANLSLSLLIFISPFAISQQTRQAVVELAPHQLNRVALRLDDGTIAHKASALAEVPIRDATPFMAYFVVWYAESWTAGNQLGITFSDGQTSTEPMPVHPDEHAESEGGRHVSQLYFLEKNQRKLRLQYHGSVGIDSIAVHFFDPGNSQAPAENAVVRRSACPCPQPAYRSRLDWCPDGSCPPDPTPVITNVTHLIVHHSAGNNTSNDWAAVVRSIWFLHVNGNLWDDIGYNWLVDPNGILYEGRGDGLLGAHYCGKNGGTMGVCVMGNYTSVPPTPEAVGKLESLLAWKACDVNIDPLGTGYHASSASNLKRISGHRDGCTTSCPGDAFYPDLQNVRQSVFCQIENNCQGGYVPTPANLQASNVLPAQVRLEWKDNATNDTGYRIERSTGTNTSFVQLVDLPPNSFSYIDYGVVSNQNYYYRVKALSGCFESTYSNEAFVSTVVTATGGETAAGQFRVFPNPASERVTVSLENDWWGEVRLELRDAAGRQAQAGRILEKTGYVLSAEFNVEGLPGGAYWVRWWQDGKAVLVPFFKN